MLKRILYSLLLLLCPIAMAQGMVRPPAIPLVAHDPYLSVWSTNDKLYDDWPRHWTGKVQAMCGMIRVDGVPMRFMGASGTAQTAEQQGVSVTATTTTYTFHCGPMALTARFTNPLLIDDLDMLTRPANYLDLSVQSLDGQPHAVQVYFDATGEWAVNEPDQLVQWKRPVVDGLAAMAIGTTEQPVLKRKGDNVRIDWGQFLVATPQGEDTTTAIGFADALRGEFAQSGTLAAKDDTPRPRPAEVRWPVLAASIDLGTTTEAQAKPITIAYDDEFSLQYFGQHCRAWWRRDPAMSTEKLLAMAATEHDTLLARCDAFDQRIANDARAAGDDDYAAVSALAYRQCITANKIIAGPQGQLFMFPKENFSNGCIGTVDVIYPQAPLYLLYSPALTRAMLLPLLEYAAMDRWKFPFAPHDLGTYPQANGQVYGGGEKTEDNQMPVEESGNMILMIAALAQREGHADFAKAHWEPISKWAAYLREKGLDPENQLCTDDFAGHLAHNVNLSAKAILALRAYGMLCEMTGNADESREYTELAKDFAARWEKMANEGTHYRLAFDKPDTWSQKYNLIWDKLLGYDLFPRAVRQKEIAHYKTVQNAFGLPLDSRKDYTKLDWIYWTATLADNDDDFRALTAPTLRFLNETPNRVPMSDWYDTKTAKMVGFQARSVVGGVFIKSLSKAMGH